MKQNRTQVSMKRKIFYYIAGFSAIMLGFLWLFQVVFLDSFYKYIKISQIKSTTHKIVENINDNDLASYLDDMSNNSDYCVRIIDMQGGVVYENNDNKGICGMLITSSSEIVNLYDDAIRNGGNTLKITNSEGFTKNFNQFERPKNPLKNEINSADNFGDKNKFQTMTYGAVSNKNNQNYFVLVNSRVTIVSEIAQTIHRQLIIIMIILLMVAICTALIISSIISKPIIKINESAKKLATGKLDVHFEGEGYLEIEELSKTLNYAGKELSKVENLRKELIANMSHDLRTPLTMIAGYGEIMRDLPGENTPENVQVIIDECNRLTSLVNDILDLSKLQAGAQILDKQNFNLTQEIQGIIKRLTTLLKNDQYNITFLYEEEIEVSADIIKMSQVIYNLLVNAIHYTGKDHKVVVKQIIKEEIVRIEIIDSGIGISKEDLESVWERYYKLDKIHTRSQVGTGLGLSIVKNILELHNADYGVNSKLNEGSVFFFELKR